MTATLLYYSILFALLITGIGLMKGNRFSKFMKTSGKWLKAATFEKYHDISSDPEFMKGTGLSVSKKAYEFYRLSFLLICFIIGILLLKTGIIVAGISLYILTVPLEKAGSLITPFGQILKLLRQYQADKVDAEIYEAMALLKNILFTDNKNPGGSDTIIEQLAGYSSLLKPHYFKMLNYLRLNRKEDAIAYFAKEAGTKMSSDFGRLLLQIDEIRPRELEETILSYQKSMREVKITKQKQQDELISDLLYLPVIINVLLIFVNFIYVSYFIEQKTMFGILAQ
jgi:hypothetical protein